MLGLSKSKPFAKDKLKLTQKIKVVFHRLENIVGKEQNAGYQHSFFSPMFSKGNFLQCVKSRRCVLKGYNEERQGVSVCPHFSGHFRKCSPSLCPVPFYKIGVSKH